MVQKKGIDKKKGILNISVSIGFKFIIMIVSIIVKRFLIQSCGNDVNGLNALYLSIIGFLSVAELGIGSAITFCMYKPIVEEDTDKVSALYQLFNRIYYVIGGVILLSGLALVPFIGYFAKDYSQLDVNMYLTFVLMLISVVMTYPYGAKSALINAHKNNYITTAIFSCGGLLQYTLQIFVLLLTRSFEWYLICRSISALAQGVATEIVARKKYGAIIANKQKLDSESKKELTRSIKAMFMHKVGYLLVKTVDSVVISAFVGVVSLGAYSNYNAILSSLSGVISLVFSSITSVLGHLYVEADKESSEKYCEILHLINFMLGVVFYLGYYAIIDDLIAILFSADLIVSKMLSLVIALNGFVQFLRTSVLVFRDATGTFYHDRWKPIIEGVVNILLSIWFVNWMGVPGVIVATVITTLLICHTIEPYVLYKNAFESSPVRYYSKNYVMIAVFFVGMIALDLCMISVENPITELLINGFISVGVSTVICTTVLLVNWKTSKNLMKRVFGRRKL